VTVNLLLFEWLSAAVVDSVSLRPLPLAHSLPSSISCSWPAAQWAVTRPSWLWYRVWLLWHWLAVGRCTSVSLYSL